MICLETRWFALNLVSCKSFSETLPCINHVTTGKITLKVLWCWRSVQRKANSDFIYSQQRRTLLSDKHWSLYDVSPTQAWTALLWRLDSAAVNITRGKQAHIKMHTVFYSKCMVFHFRMFNTSHVHLHNASSHAFYCLELTH